MLESLSLAHADTNARASPRPSARRADLPTPPESCSRLRAILLRLRHAALAMAPDVERKGGCCGC